MTSISLSLLMVGVLHGLPTAGAPEGSYKQSLAEAVRAGKPLLVVIGDAPSSLRIEGVSLARDAALEEALGHYQVCRIDASTEYGQRIAGLFKATTLPHYSIIDKTGQKQILIQRGAFGEGEMLTALVAHQDGEAHTSTRSSGTVRRGRICFT